MGVFTCSRAVLRVGFSLLLLLGVPQLVFAQSALACAGARQSVVSAVLDSSQAGIPEAAIRASCGSVVEATTTDSNGGYRLRLAPGLWTVETIAPGFAPSTTILSVGPEETKTPPIVLAVAKQSLDVTVTTEAGLVQTSADSVSKSATPILEQPFDIQTVTATQMLQQNVQTLNQALKYTAGATPEVYGPDPRGDWFFLRGNAADVYLDGMRLPQVVNSPNSFAAVQVDPNDLQNLQILEGPSSTLYGQSNLGGIVDAVSKKPSLLPHRSIQLQGGNFDRIQGGGDLSGPLNRSSSLLYSLTGIARSSHSYIYGAKDDRFTLNPTLEWKPTPNTSITGYGKFFHADIGTAAVFLPRIGTLTRSAAYGYLPTSFNTGDPATDVYRKRQYMFGYAVDYRTGPLVLHHTSRFVHENITYTGLYSAGAFTNAAQTLLARVNFASKPVLDGLQTDTHVRRQVRSGLFQHTLIGGVDFQWQKYQNRQGGAVDPTVTLNLLNPVYGVPHAAAAITTRVDQTQFQGGAYGQEQVQLAGWTLVAGGRYDQTAQESVTLATNVSVPQRPHALTGHAGLSFHAGGLAPYVSYSTSFLPTIGTDFSGNPFKPSRGSGYEGGLKYQLPHHTAMLTFAGFSMTQDNRTTTDPAHPLFQVQVGQVRTIGYEAQANGTVLHSVDMSFSYTHLNPVVTRSNGSTAGSVGADYHKMLQPVPKDSVGLWVHYTARRTLLRGVGLGGGSRYVGPKWGDTANTFQTPGYTLFDGALDYTLERWHFGINSANLLNKRYVSACSATTNCYYGATRSAIGSVHYSF